MGAFGELRGSVGVERRLMGNPRFNPNMQFATDGYTEETGSTLDSPIVINVHPQNQHKKQSQAGFMNADIKTFTHETIKNGKRRKRRDVAEIRQDLEEDEEAYEDKKKKMRNQKIKQKKSRRPRRGFVQTTYIPQVQSPPAQTTYLPQGQSPPAQPEGYYPLPRFPDEPYAAMVLNGEKPKMAPLDPLTPRYSKDSSPSPPVNSLFGERRANEIYRSALKDLSKLDFSDPRTVESLERTLGLRKEEEMVINRNLPEKLMAEVINTRRGDPSPLFHQMMKTESENLQREKILRSQIKDLYNSIGKEEYENSLKKKDIWAKKLESTIKILEKKKKQKEKQADLLDEIDQLETKRNFILDVPSAESNDDFFFIPESQKHQKDPNFRNLVHSLVEAYPAQE